MVFQAIDAYNKWQAKPLSVSTQALDAYFKLKKEGVFN
jgi:hypothetical protein